MTVRRALRISLWGEVGLLAVLAVTGAWLTWYYRPIDQGMRAIHRLSGLLLIWNALLVLALCIGVAVEEKAAPRSRFWILGAAFAVVAWFTSLTGFLLPWDQLALRAVTIDSNFHGMWSAVFSDNVRFALIGSHEISQSLLRNWFIAHSFVLGPALAVGLALLGRRVRD